MNTEEKQGIGSAVFSSQKNFPKPMSMNPEEKQAIAGESLSSAAKGATIAAASSIATGVAITATPVTTFFGLVTVGTTTAVALPVVVTAGVIGAVAFGGIAGYRKYKKIQAIKKMMGE